MYLVSWERFTFHSFPCLWEIRVRLCLGGILQVALPIIQVRAPGRHAPCPWKQLCPHRHAWRDKALSLFSRAMQSWKGQITQCCMLWNDLVVFRVVWTGTVVALAASCLMLFQTEVLQSSNLATCLGHCTCTMFDPDQGVLSIDSYRLFLN